MGATERIVTLKKQSDAGGLDLSWYDIGVQAGLDPDDYPSEEHLADATRKRYERAVDDGDAPDAEAERLREKIEVEDVSENEKVVTATTTAIKTLEQLVKACDIDLDEWEPLKPLYNAWTTPGKTRQDTWIQIQNYQVKCRFIRKEPLAIHPVIQPVKAAAVYPRPKAPVGNSVTSLFLGDPHLGYWRDVHTGKLTPMHDRRALDIAVQIARELQPDTMEFLGDWFDAARQSSNFRQEPEFYWTTQPAINEGHWWLARFCDACPSAEKRLYEGNHDVRIINYIKDHAQWAYQLKGVADVYPALSLPRLLDLGSLQIEWIGGYPKDSYRCPADWVKFQHGKTARVAGATGRHEMQGSTVWKFHGHIHRQEVVAGTTDHGNDDVRACFVSPGMLAHADRLPGANGNDNWGQGVGIAHYSIDKPEVSIELVSIENGRAIWRGKVYEGVDCVDDVRESFPEFHW
jgi:hypothetical protein